MRRGTQRRPAALGLLILQGVAIVLCCAALAFAAAKTTGVAKATSDARTVKTAKAASTGESVNAQARTETPASAKPGDIIIRGKAGAYTNVDYGQSPRPEHDADSARSGGQ